MNLFMVKIKIEINPKNKKEKNMLTEGKQDGNINFVADGATKNIEKAIEIAEAELQREPNFAYMRDTYLPSLKQ